MSGTFFRKYMSIFLLVLGAAPSTFAASSSLSSYSFPKSQKVKINSELLGACLALETKRSSDGFYFDRSLDNSGQGIDDFVQYLAAGASRRYDFMTGNEPRLRQWIMAQPLNSIDPVSLYKASLSLNQGNIFNAVLTIHQLLRNEARFYDKRRYHYLSTIERRHALFDRMIDIRGDLTERGPGFSGDHTGSWYRIWGTMLYELMWMPEKLSISNKSLSLHQKFVADIGNQVGKSLARYDELSKLLGAGETDLKGKLSTDLSGAEIAHALMKDVYSSMDISAFRFLPPLCQNRKYLSPIEKDSGKNSSLFAAALPNVDLTDQMSPTLKQKGGTCYAYSFTAAVEAALYREDHIHREISPDYLFTRALAGHSVDSLRLIKTLIGINYADGQLGKNNADMFYFLAKDLFTEGTYVDENDFRPLYDEAMAHGEKDSILNVLKYTFKPKGQPIPKAVQIYKKLQIRGALMETYEPKAQRLRMNRVWSKGQGEESLFTSLSRLLRAKIPPIIVFYYDVNRTQVSRGSSDHWTPLASPLFSMPTWHAVLLEKVETDSNGVSYLIFRDSYEAGSETNPNASKIRMRAADAPDLITQVLYITTPSDSLH